VKVITNSKAPIARKDAKTRANYNWPRSQKRTLVLAKTSINDASRVFGHMNSNQVTTQETWN
jgi:hypothetical protein